MKHNLYLKNLKYCIFDIETTGLYPKHDMVISASFLDDNLTQLFCESPLEEPQIIQDIFDKLSEYDAVITYNGNRFDLPFILERAKKYDLYNNLPIFWPIDAYKYLRKYWPAAKTMDSLSQKSVEYALGLSEDRTDPIGGGECIPLYNSYISTGDKSAKDAILLHNGDDVRQLKRICDCLSFLPYHQISFEDGYIVKNDYYKIRIKESALNKKKLSAEGYTVKGLLPISVFEDSFKFEYDHDSGKFSLEIYPEMKEDKVFVDLTKIPLDEKLFEGKSYSGFLPMNYSGANLLISELVKKLLS